MSWLLVPAWLALVYALLTLLRIRVTPWTIGTAALAGLLAIGALVAAMTQAQPYSGRLRIVAPESEIVPAVSGRIVEVPARAGVPLKAGDVLFRIDPAPYELTVQQRKAAVAETEQQLAALKAAQEAARDEPARTALRAQADAAGATLARRRTELAAAEYDLARTVVRAPAAGSFAGGSVRPGAYASAGAATAAAIFVQDSPADRIVAARFRPSVVQRVRIGDEAEIAFNAVPGRIFKAKVRSIAPALPTGGGAGVGGRRAAAVVTFDPVDDIAGYTLTAGATGVAAIYTDQGQSVAIVRRILLRMTSWLGYLCG